jgi:serine protease Do
MRQWRTWVTAMALLLACGMPGARPAQAQDLQFNQAQLIRSLLPTVVNILAHAAISTPDSAALTASATQSSDFFQIKSSAGSGFICDPSGVIVTNWHVVDGAYEIFVTFSDGTRVKADLLNAARIVDIALLKVDVGHKLPAVKWADSSKVQIGDPVLAIGNPLGVGESVTAGIVSALNRNIMDTPYDDFIQTDAAINHGNSGGPLFDMTGALIGINTALISTTSSSAGLGFAIPANDGHSVVERLMHFGWVRPAYMGMKIQQVTPEMAAGLGMKEPKGSIVAWVRDDSPASAAGLLAGDVVMTFDGRVPTDERELLRTIAASVPGQKVQLTVLRNGRETELSATLIEWPKMSWEQRDAPVRVVEPHWNIPPDLGIKVTKLTEQLRAENEIPPGPPGALVTGVTQDADAARRGVTPGDVVLQVGTTPVTDAAEMLRELDRVRGEGRVYAMFLLLPKGSLDAKAKSPGPKWVPLRVSG